LSDNTSQDDRAVAATEEAGQADRINELVAAMGFTAKFDTEF
jgi:hypothetical protein